VCYVTMSLMIQLKESKLYFLVIFLAATNYLLLSRLSDVLGSILENKDKPPPTLKTSAQIESMPLTCTQGAG
jgi:hypothetical protein